jgi:hypothetical protein
MKRILREKVLHLDFECGQPEILAALQDRPHRRAFWSATATTARP